MSHRVIWKYEVSPNISIDLPADAQIIHADALDEGIFIWVLVSPDAPKVKREFAVYGTGHMICHDKPMDHIGTVTFKNSGLVFHVFEIL